jgi:uncharacterized protein (TIGR03032 family)
VRRITVRESADHPAQWRDPAQITSQWQEAIQTDPSLFRCEARGAWWETLAETGATLFVTREYEHLVMALRADDTGPHMSYMRLPHPSGLVVDRDRGLVHVASTRNPNQVYDLAPITGLLCREDIEAEAPADRPVVPIRSRFLPGALYLHDLALIGDVLHANSVGQNAIVRLQPDGRHQRVWWPRCIEAGNGPAFGRNYIQLNSIAAGPSLTESYFSASSDTLSSRRPGHRNFPVDRRGVLFSGATREVAARGLTRPHSARLFERQVWVDNSGYGELGIATDGRFDPFVRLPGWTRGLCFHGTIAFVGTSHVIPRFRQYAPGLEVDRSLCGLHAVNAHSGELLGSLIWPYGNQIFAVDWAPRELTGGFPFTVGRRPSRREKALFYTFRADDPRW